MDLLSWVDGEGTRRRIERATDWPAARERILRAMELVMGELPGKERKVPLDIEVLGVERLPGLERRKITYASEAGHRVPAYLLVPDGSGRPMPAALSLHGTGGGRGRTAGVGEPYPAYTLELAQRGMVAIAPDYITLGDNLADPAALGYASGTMKGIWDHMRAVDLLQSLPEVDAARVCAIGLSLGGHNALFVAAFDPRIKAVVTSSGFDSFHDYMGGNLAGWCQGRYMPRIETVYGKDPARLPFDFPQVLAAIAPRPIFVHAPLGDTNFRSDSVRRCIDEALPVYRLLGAEEDFVAIYPEGGHGFPLEARQQAFAFLRRHL